MRVSPLVRTLGCGALLITLFFLAPGLAPAQEKDFKPIPDASVIINSQQASEQKKADKPPEAASSAQENKPEYSMHVDVPLVTLDVSVLTPDGYFVNELRKENFRVLEDGMRQVITGFSQIHAPVTAVFLVEHAVDGFAMQLNALRASSYFTRFLKPEDWTALILFDKRPHIFQDFTQDKEQFRTSLNSVGIPLLRDANLFDALYETVDRLQAVQGRKYIILLARGGDSLSRKDLDEVYKKIESAKDTVIYSIETDRDSEHRQETNQMRTFARVSGGQFFFASSLQEFADAFRTIGQSIRNHYILSYQPARTARDGAWHKIKVEVVTATGHKPPYQIVARDGYRSGRKGN